MGEAHWCARYRLGSYTSRSDGRKRAAHYRLDVTPCRDHSYRRLCNGHSRTGYHLSRVSPRRLSRIDGDTRRIANASIPVSLIVMAFSSRPVSSSCAGFAVCFVIQQATATPKRHVRICVTVRRLLFFPHAREGEHVAESSAVLANFRSRRRWSCHTRDSTLQRHNATPQRNPVVMTC